MEKILLFICLLIPILGNSQYISSSDLEKMVNLNQSEFHNAVIEKGYKFNLEMDPPLGSEVYGKLRIYSFLDGDKPLWNIVYSKAGFISYYSDEKTFLRLKHEIENKYKKVATTNALGTNQIIYKTTRNRFHVILNDGTGRKLISVFYGHGDM